MLTHAQRTRTRLFQVADGCLFVTALLAAYFLRAACAGWLGWQELEAIEDYLWLAPVVALLGPMVLAGQGFYESPRTGQRLHALFAMLRSCVFTVFGLIVFLFIIRIQLARSVIILVGTIGGGLVYIRYEVTTRLHSRRFAQEQLRRRALWVGLPSENQLLRDALTRLERDTLVDSGEFNPATQPVGELVGMLHELAVNVVILNLAGVGRDQATSVLLACSNEGVEVLVRPGLSTLPSPHVTIDQFGGEAVLYYRAQSAPLSHLLVKQLVDYVLAALLLLLLSPLLALIAIAIRLTSPGAALYRQVRSGLNGRSFLMLKFRSMRSDAELEQASLAERNEMRGPVFKVTNDPRVTPVGRLLRRHSLDELPQLWNVLRGEMSLVGPRPLPIEEVKRFDHDTHRRRLSVKPGLTCLWQISGRNDIADFADWVRLDLNYIDQWSLWLDFKILLATIPAALFGRGAR
ncbi:MAG: exopolysaccharide biosynthesis polyprenyl glycosylphosphotransferase [Verrucomicrobia bacterium]|nr:exopolysaccharide biosynthesis polyprenyl glycosylphosphotransferase [Verrucomicrobiota bacterium]